MLRTTEISTHDCAIIAKKIRENIFTPAFTFKTTIFLCGADINKKTTIRHKIAKVITEKLWYSRYDLIYPEDIFDELLYGPKSTDLLSLENLLADSVDAVVMIPESPGSYAELGAFANNEKLRSKLICVIDEKYKKNKSFINQGPLKLVRDVNKDGIIYIDPDRIGKDESPIKEYSILSQDKEVEKIISSINKLKKSTTKSGKVTLLQLDRFLLPTIYLLEPVKKNILIEIVDNAIEDTRFSKSSATTAITILTKKRFIELTANGYKLTELGRNEFLDFRTKNSRFKQQDKIVIIDNLRLEILNLQNRRKKMKA